MNRITRELVTDLARKHKAAALRNDITFDFLVRENHWALMIDRFGVDLKFRALNLLRLFRPGLFVLEGDEWILDDGHKDGFDIDVCVSRIAERVLRRKVDRSPDLRLDDWGDLPRQVADPQLRMF